MSRGIASKSTGSPQRTRTSAGQRDQPRPSWQLEPWDLLNDRATIAESLGESAWGQKGGDAPLLLRRSSNHPVEHSLGTAQCTARVNDEQPRSRWSLSCHQTEP
jgi:hypothetical protein